MKKISCVSVALLLTAAMVHSVQAAPSRAARIDIDCMAPDVVYLTVGDVENGTAENKPGGKWRNSAIRSRFPAGAEWKQGKFSFTPDKDGTLTIHVMGEWAPEEGDRSWVICDGVELEGAELKNGSFESGMQSWWKTGSKKLAEIVPDAKAGEKGVKVNHDNGFMQKFIVKKGEAVTVTFWYKLVE